MSFHQFINHETGEFYGSYEIFFTEGRDKYDYHDLPEFECIHGKGYYWQACFPGCLPDGDAIGPFDTEKEAIDSALSN